MCLCEEDCVKYSLYHTKFDKECTYYDLNDLILDDKYYSTVLITNKVIFKRFEDENYDCDEFSLTKDIYNNFINLCDNIEGAFDKLKCNLYELKDYCKSNDTCFDSMLNYESVLTFADKRLYRDLCVNTNFDKDLKRLQSKIEFSPLYRPKRDLKLLRTFENSGSDIYEGNLCSTLFLICIPISIILLCITTYFAKRKFFNWALLYGSLFSIVAVFLIKKYVL